MDAKTYSNFPKNFQIECIKYIEKLVSASYYRFLYINPHITQIGVFEGHELKDVNRDKIEKEYQEKFWDLDPLHPRHFENTTINVVCSNLLMTVEEYVETPFYKEFMSKGEGILYDAEIFFRKDNEIIAVLSLLRKNEFPAFTQEEITSLENVQPFLEYMLNELYTPARTDERQYIKEKYSLTRRELDVLEHAMSGYSNKVIANQINLSITTVRSHLMSIYGKVDVHSTNELLATLYKELQ